MNCNGCKKAFPEPDVIDDVAYFVCTSCGNVYEIAYNSLQTPQQQLAAFEKATGFKLPDEYFDFANSEANWVVRLPPAKTESLKYYFGEGYYEIGPPSELMQLYIDSPYLVEEWGLPKDLLLIQGDGHTWLALDYRKSRIEPKVIVIETDHYNHLEIAGNFKAFLKALLPYESIYDSNGNIVTQG